MKFTLFFLPYKIINIGKLSNINNPLNNKKVFKYLLLNPYSGSRNAVISIPPINPRFISTAL